MESEVKQQPQKYEVIKLLMAVPISLMLLSVVAIALLIGYEVVYAGRVYPGVYMQNISLSGMTLEESARLITGALPRAYQGKIQFTYQDRVWEAEPMDLGFLVDPTSSAKQALGVGRRGWFLSNLFEKGRAWFNGIQLSPVAVYDERVAQAYLENIAAEINQPVIEATLALENTEVIVKSGQVGRQLDVSGTLAAIETLLTHMQSGVVPLVVTETEPLILDASAQAELARQILSESLVLTDGEGDETETWTIPPEDLAAMLVITRVEDSEADNLSYQIALNEDLFSVYLNGLAPEVQVRPANPRFVFNDDTAELEVIQPAVIGRTLNIQSSIEHINAQLQAGKHKITLQFNVVVPEVTDDMTGEELGITELFQSWTTYFYGSDAARKQNIEISSSQFHGLLVAPGETFSMAEALGDISLENGYAEALIIYGDQTIQGVGGGVCQVSTTLFRTAFFAGFPIVERHAHAYRVSYYEYEYNGTKNPKWAGLDATVYVPIVDLKFTNDTDNWLLMETYVVGESLTWKFYSTKDGRTVDWDTTGLTNKVPAPDPIYRENADLKKGEIKQVDYAAEGADVTIKRTVYKDGKVYFSDVFRTHYQPWQAVFEYGPGTEDIPESDSD
jgi:vancomycin resistance protein YoaR